VRNTQDAQRDLCRAAAQQSLHIDVFAGARPTHLPPPATEKTHSTPTSHTPTHTVTHTPTPLRRTRTARPQPPRAPPAAAAAPFVPPAHVSTPAPYVFAAPYPQYAPAQWPAFVQPPPPPHPHPHPHAHALPTPFVPHPHAPPPFAPAPPPRDYAYAFPAEYSPPASSFRPAGDVLHRGAPSQPTLRRRARGTLETGASHVPPPENRLDLERIASGQDMRTTVMIKNIPNKMSDRDLLAYIERVVKRRIDFFYLRMDFQNGERASSLYPKNGRDVDGRDRMQCGLRVCELYHGG